MERKCAYLKCENIIVRKPYERSDKFRAKKYCSTKCCRKDHKLRTEEGDRNTRSKQYSVVPDNTRFQLTEAEEREQAAAVVSVALRICADLPRTPGESMRSAVKVYRPGDPEFDAIAATVTPIEEIPDRHEESILYYHLG